MSAKPPAGRTRRDLWQDYLFLSQELSKFVSPEDFELFTDLLDQRSRLQPLIEAAPDADGYQKSEDFRTLVERVTVLNESIASRLRFFKNAALKQRDLANAYDGYVDDFTAGYRMDKRS